MSDGEVLGKLKARLQEISDLIDAAESKKVTARGTQVYALTDLEKHELELQATKRRYLLLEQDLKDFTERHGVQDAKLKEITASIESIETQRGELEEKEGDLDSSIIGIEEKVREAKHNLEINEFKLSTEEQKKVVISRDLGKMNEKAEGLEKRCQLLEETLTKAGQNLDEMEERENGYQDREMQNEEKVLFLEGQNRETEVRADQAERYCQTCERGIIETTEEIAHWVRKINALEAEMLAMDEVTKIEEDIDKVEMAYDAKCD